MTSPACRACNAQLLLGGPHDDPAAWMREAGLEPLTPRAADYVLARPCHFSPRGSAMLNFEEFVYDPQTRRQLVSLQQGTRVGFLCAVALQAHARDALVRGKS